MKNSQEKKSPIVLIGGGGRLGRAILSVRPSTVSPTKSELDIVSYQGVWNYLWFVKPKIVILAAALVGRQECEKNPYLARKINILGPRHVAQVCEKIKAKLIFISTCAVFDGKKGNYSENDTANPVYFYAETKLEAEQIISEIIEDYLIIRTDFFDSNQFKYETVFIDHFCSKEPTSLIARKINLLIETNVNGTIHVGGPRNCLFDILKPYFPQIIPITITESIMPDFPKDLSLSTKKFSLHAMNHGLKFMTFE